MDGPDAPHRGCLEITRALLRVKSRLHVFGHIHGGYGREDGPHGVSCVNCAILVRFNNGKLGLRKPIVIDFDRSPNAN